MEIVSATRAGARSLRGILGWVLVCFGAATCVGQNSANPDKQASVSWHDPSPSPSAAPRRTSSQEEPRLARNFREHRAAGTAWHCPRTLSSESPCHSLVQQSYKREN